LFRVCFVCFVLLFSFRASSICVPAPLNIMSLSVVLSCLFCFGSCAHMTRFAALVCLHCVVFVLFLCSCLVELPFFAPNQNQANFFHSAVHFRALSPSKLALQIRFRLVSFRFGSFRLGSVRFGSFRLGSFRFSSVRFVSVQLVSFRFVSFRFVSCRFGSEIRTISRAWLVQSPCLRTARKLGTQKAEKQNQRKRYPSSVVRPFVRPSSVVRRPSSVVRRPSSVRPSVRRPSSVARRPSSVRFVLVSFVSARLVSIRSVSKMLFIESETCENSLHREKVKWKDGSYKVKNVKFHCAVKKVSTGREQKQESENGQQPWRS
jgi:hypothetical protein